MKISFQMFKLWEVKKLSLFKENAIVTKEIVQFPKILGIH
jgi:hypothetical protein